MQDEQTNNRDLSYNLWHRILHKKCGITDIDFVEWRLY